MYLQNFVIALVTILCMTQGQIAILNSCCDLDKGEF